MEPNNNNINSGEPMLSADNESLNNLAIPTNHDYDIHNKRSNTKKALLFILVPLLILILSLFAVAINSREPEAMPVYTNGQDTGLVTSVSEQNIIPPQFILLITLLTPCLLMAMLYGLILLVKKPTNVSSNTNVIAKPKSKPSYLTPLITFAVGAILFLLGMLSLYNIRSDVGYSGSESEIASFPLFFSGIITIFISAIFYFTTAARRYQYDKKNSLPRRKI
ncbi:MAG: hypothetical protein QG628_327 [Patescibacteria group bacterium]|nr:hypothetical protein [Patescibacteria group bacterium]